MSSKRPPKRPALDLTDAELASRSALLQAVFDATPDLIFVKDPEFRIVLCNRAFAGAVGKTPEELCGRTDIENGWDPVLVRGDSARGIRGFEEDDRVALTGQVIHNRQDPANIDGEIHYFDTHKIPLRDTEGRIFAILGMSRDVTNRKQVEETLQAREKQLRDIGDVLPSGAVYRLTHGPDGRRFFEHVSAGFERIFRLSAETVTKDAMALYEMVHPEDLDAAMQAEQYAAENIAPFKHECRFILPDGEIRWMGWHSMPSRLPHGELSWSGVVLDVTERKLATQALQASEERLKVIADYTYSWENWVGPNGKLLWISPAVERIIGYSAAECLGMPDYPMCYVHEDDREKVNTVFREAVTNETSGDDFEFRFRHRDGRVVWGAVSWQQIYSQTGLHLGHRSSVRDVTNRKTAELALKKANDGLEARIIERTSELIAANRLLEIQIEERKRTENALRESEERYRRLFENSVAAVFLVNAQGNFVDVNQAGLDLLGYSRSELLHMSISDVDADPEAVSEAQQNVFAGGRVMDFEHELKRKDGAIVTALSNTRALIDASGHVKGAQSTMIDITARKRAEEEAHARRTEAAHLARVNTIGQLTVEVAHEVNQPLTSITNFANGCLRRMSRDGVAPELRSAMSSIVELSMNTREVVQRIRSYTRKGARRKKGFEVAQVIRDGVALIEEDAKRNGVRVRLDMRAPGDRSFGVPLEIEQVLINLMLNALEAMAEESDTDRSLTISQTCEGNRILVSVRDTGPGIPEDRINRVFDSFFTTKEEGLGLGLAISRAIVEAHEGTIWARPATDGRGTVFCFTLPKADAKRNR